MQDNKPWQVGLMGLFGDWDFNNNAKQLAPAVFQGVVSMIECPDRQPRLASRTSHQLWKSTLGNSVLLLFLRGWLHLLLACHSSPLCIVQCFPSGDLFSLRQPGAGRLVNSRWMSYVGAGKTSKKSGPAGIIFYALSMTETVGLLRFWINMWIHHILWVFEAKPLGLVVTSTYTVFYGFRRKSCS